ncbi:hypothetical protein ACET3Z_025735 [Daucus carota]
MQYNFFPVQQSSILPSHSEPTPSNIQTHDIPQTQSTSQPLPADSDIDIELQNFHDDLQVAEVLSNFSSNFTVDVSDYDCDIDFVCQTASIEPENTQVHNPADDFVSTTDSSSNTSTNTTTPVVKKVARKRSGSTMIREPAALSHKKLRVDEPETTAAASISSQKDLDTEMVNIQSLDSFSQQDAFIEICRPTAVPCKESSTSLALTLVNTQPDPFVTTLNECTDFQNMFNENFSDHSFFIDQGLLGSLQVNLPSQAFEGQFVPSLPMVPSQGTLVVYTGTGDSVINTSEERQKPSETHARENRDHSSSVREVSAHTNTDLLLEQMATLRDECERLLAENAKLKSGELVTLQKQVADTSYTSLQRKMDEHVKGIYSRIDKNHELCMSKLHSMEQTLAQVVDFLKIPKSTAQSTPEDPSTKGEKDKDKDQEDKGGASKGKESSKDSSKAAKYDKSKGKMPASDDIFSNQDYDNIPEDVADDDAFDAAYFQAEEEGHFEESFLFTEDVSVDPEHLERVGKFKAEHEASKAKLRELQRLVDEKKITDELIKVEKQRLWDAKCKEKREDISRKVGESWDIARQILSGPQREPFEDGKFKSFIYDLREANPNEDMFMRALTLELEYITIGVKNLLDLWEIIISTQRNGTFRVSIGLFNPQVVRNPYCVKFFHESKFGTFYLDYQRLLKYDVNQMVLVSTILRTKGFASKAKADADAEIVAYCTKRKVHHYFRKMKYINPTQPSDFIEDPVDTEVQFQLSLARERKKRGESTISEETTQNEPSTPIIHVSDIEEREFTRSK